MMDDPYLLIDARNVMYRAIFANQGSNRRHHHFTVMLQFISEIVEEFKPIFVGIFWDAKKRTLWRRNLYHGYKDRDLSKYRTDIKDELIYTESAAKALFKHMGVLQFNKKKQEADDLIYSACRVLAPRRIIMVSTDKDLHQIIFRMPHVQQYDHYKGELVEPPSFDPVVQKALAGDKSDTVDGYQNIGPVKGKRLAESFELRQKFFEARGRKIYLRNMLLMDLGYNPNLLANDTYVAKKLCEEPVFDKKAILEAAKKHKVSGLVSDFARVVTPLSIMSEVNNNRE